MAAAHFPYQSRENLTLELPTPYLKRQGNSTQLMELLLHINPPLKGLELVISLLSLRTEGEAHYLISFWFSRWSGKLNNNEQLDA